MGNETKSGVMDPHRGCKTQSPMLPLRGGLGSNSKQARLNLANCMAYFGITGAMRTAPTTATEVLLGLCPLHLQMQLKPEQKFTDSNDQ